MFMVCVGVEHLVAHLPYIKDNVQLSVPPLEPL